MPTTLPVNRIVQGHVLDVLSTLPSDSIDMVVTSPPYWALRDFQGQDQIWGATKLCKHEWNGGRTCGRCTAWRGQLGLEPTFDLFVRHLCQIFDQVRRVLKPEGTCWVNLGDTYSGSSCGSNDRRKRTGLGSDIQEVYAGQHAGKTRLPNKCLIQVPSRFAIEMCERKWMLRNTIIWHKPNCLPASVKDRFLVDFEYLIFFVKSKRYFFDIDAARQPLSREQRAEAQRLARRYGYDGKTSYEDWYFKRRKKASWIPGPRNLVMGMQAVRGMGRNRPYLLHPFGKTRRCVWSIAPRPFSGAHFAVYPSGLLETPIKAGCPENGIVLDPFMGSGTTALAALQLGRRFIGIELNPEYVRIANQRLKLHLTEARLVA